MEQQTSFEKAHAMVEHIFRALLPEPRPYDTGSADHAVP